MLERIARTRLLASLWLLVITILFLLPGSALPKNDMIIPHFDKYVHFGFFAVLLFLWRIHLEPAIKYSFFLLLLGFVYGLGIEIIQHYLIANRSFDMGDVLADMAGAVVGVLAWWYIKK